MIITRVIDGKEVEIELTHAEEYEIYNKGKYGYYKDDIDYVLDMGFEGEVELSEEEMNTAIRYYEEYRDNCSWYEDAYAAVRDVLENREV